MKRLSILVLAGALAACGQEPADDAANGADTTAVSDTGTMQHNAELDQKVMAALQQCKQVEPTCDQGSPAGYFVFPDVTSIALGVGGEGGNGALVKDGRIVDYYRMGEGSVGLEAGISAASYVFKVQDEQALDQYQKDGEWSIGAESAVTIAAADANAQAETGDKTLAYVFNSEGLMGDASIDVMKIWRTDEEG